MRAYLLLPAKDEAESLPWLLGRATGAGLVPVVCDDGSGDGTGERARALGALVLSHPENRGLAEALRTLFLWFLEEGRPGDLALVMDADGTMDPGLFPAMREALEREGAEVVVASRFRGRAEGVPPLRGLLSWGARAFFSLLHPVPGLTDYTTGWRLYRYELLARYRAAFPLLFRAPGFSAQTEMLLRMRRLSPPPKVVEVGAVLRYGAKRGSSKMRILRTAGEYLRLGVSLLGEGR